jgi:hypothetical protein
MAKTHLEISDFPAKLAEIETFALERNDYRVKRLVGELKRAAKMHATSQALLKEEGGGLRKEVDRLKKQAVTLQSQVEAAFESYHSSLITFEKFRSGIRIVEQMRTHEDLPGIVEGIKKLFNLRAVGLLLDEAEYAPFLPDSIRRAPRDAIRRAVAAAIPDPVRRASFMGPVTDVPDLEFFFGPSILGGGGAPRLGSCFIYPLKDKFGPQKMVGVIGFFDGNPKRYAREKRADFLEHFCDILGYAVVDVTDRKKADALREDVERMTRHDLKSPLTAILTLPQLFKREADLTPRQTEMLNLVQSAGYRMLHMINQSLDLYRMERGVYELSPQPVDLLPILDNIAAELHGMMETRALGMDIILSGRPRQEGDAFVIRGEEMLCYTMFSNLVRNAVEASPQEGRITVTLAENASHDVAVHNAGAVPQDIRSRFFHKYVTAGKKDGTGLGTYGAKLIAETHGGRIRMETSESHGTTVTVHFPK